MPDMWMNVDAALAEVPVNILPLIDDTDFKSRETAIVYNQSGMDLVWNFVTAAGAFTQTAVTPTTSGDYDWTNQGDGMYTIEIPASGGASINNDTEGYGWFTGVCDGVLPWRGPVIGFRVAGQNDLTTALFNRIADHVWRRANGSIEDSSDGDTYDEQSPYGMVAFFTNKVSPSGGNIDVYEADGVTVFYYRTPTTDAGANPITGMSEAT